MNRHEFVANVYASGNFTFTTVSVLGEIVSAVVPELRPHGFGRLKSPFPELSGILENAPAIWLHP